MKLFGHNPSPYVRRILVLIHELGLEVERDSHGWMSEPSPEFLAHSPIKRLPMLDRGPAAKVRFVYESEVIASVLYAAPEKRPTADLQKTLFRPELQEADRNLLSATNAALDAAINLFVMEKDGLTKANSSYLQRQTDRVQECLAWVDGHYRGQVTFTPGQFAYVDIATLTTLQWLRYRNRADVTQWPNLVAAEKALGIRPSFGALPPPL